MARDPMEVLCGSASVSYRGNLTPAALLAFLRSGVVADDCRTQLEYAIEELPPGMWGKALRAFDKAEQSAMKRTIGEFAAARRLFLSPDMRAWLGHI